MRLDLPRRTQLGLLLFTLVTIGLGLLLSARFGGPAVRTSAPFRVQATLADAQGLAKGSDVLIRGVKAGQVGAVRAAPGGRTRLTLELDRDDVRLIHADATARTGSKTPLGEVFVALDPGSPRARPVAEGARIASAPSVQLDEALEALNPDARRDLRKLLADSGRGLRSPAAGARIGATVTALDDATRAFDDISQTLQGQAGDIAGTVTDAQAMVGALAQRAATLRALIADARRTLDAAGADRPALRALLAELPAVTREATGTLAAADGLVRDAQAPVRDLRRAASPTAAALRAAPAPLDDLATVLGRAPAVRRAATPALAALRRALPQLTPALRTTGPALADLVPVLDYLAPRRREIAAWFTNTDALGRNGDSKGRWARFFIGLDPATATGLPLGGARQRNPYPQPGDAAANRPYARGDYPRLMPYLPALRGTGKARTAGPDAP